MKAFDPKAEIGPVYGYYSTADGELLSMPFNFWTPVFYWNKELFQKAGLDPSQPPTTWPEVGAMGKKQSRPACRAASRFSGRPGR